MTLSRWTVYGGWTVRGSWTVGGGLGPLADLPGLVILAILAALAACSGEPGGSRGSSTEGLVDDFGPGPEGRLGVTAFLGGGSSEEDAAGFQRAVEPRPFAFPEDHGPHPDFRTEWWYLTGHLTAEAGTRFGYQFTVFRVALSPDSMEGSSGWRTNQAYMAHFAVTDVDGGRFLSQERFARGALGLAGARARPFRVWLDDWFLGRAALEAPEGDSGAFPARLVARTDEVSLDLLLDRGKEPVPQGDDGLSVKGPGVGNASHYYSLTRMPTTGRVVLGPDTLRVEGSSWMDREWSTSGLGPGVEGWDWFALQLEGDRELMYYRLRREDGTTSPRSGGTWIEGDGSVRAVEPGELNVRPTGWWESPDGGVRYPLSWELELASEELTATLVPVLEDQEWRGAFRYWEGAMDVRGTLRGDPIGGRAYLELTGYE